MTSGQRLFPRAQILLSRHPRRPGLGAPPAPLALPLTLTLFTPRARLDGKKTHPFLLPQPQSHPTKWPTRPQAGPWHWRLGPSRLPRSRGDTGRLGRASGRRSRSGSLKMSGFQEGNAGPGAAGEAGQLPFTVESCGPPQSVPITTSRYSAPCTETSLTDRRRSKDSGSGCQIPTAKITY